MKLSDLTLKQYTDHHQPADYQPDAEPLQHEVSVLKFEEHMYTGAANSDADTDNAGEIVTRVAFIHWHIRGQSGRLVDLKHMSDDVRLKAYLHVGSRREPTALSGFGHGATVIYDRTGLVYKRAKKSEQDSMPPELIRFVAMHQAVHLRGRVDILPDMDYNKCIICRKPGDDVKVCCFCLMVTHSKCCQEHVVDHLLEESQIGAGPALEAVLPEELLHLFRLDRTVLEGHR